MKKLILSLLTAIGLTTACAAQNNISVVDVNVFATLIKEDTTATLLDVRTHDEFMAGHIRGAQNMDYLQEEKFKEEIKTLSKQRTYYVYCRSGRRSHNAATLMQDLGLKVVDLRGGFLAWQQAGREVVTPPSGQK